MNNEHGTYESKLASRLQAYADTLSFDKLDGGEFCPKRTALQAAHALDQCSISIYRKKGGVVIRNARGKLRYLTWRERFAYWLLGDKPEIRP